MIFFLLSRASHRYNIYILKPLNPPTIFHIRTIFKKIKLKTLFFSPKTRYVSLIKKPILIFKNKQNLIDTNTNSARTEHTRRWFTLLTSRFTSSFSLWLKPFTSSLSLALSVPLYWLMSWPLKLGTFL